MKKATKISLSILITIIAFSGFVYFTTYHPDEVQQEIIFNSEQSPILEPGQQIKILSWNIQFLAGNKDNDFFFEGGNDPWPQKETIDFITGEVARVLTEENPDIIFLQEVDEGSKRTYNEDQLDNLLRMIPKEYTSHTSTFYWQAMFIPHPEILGSIGMKLSIISKFKIENAFRYALSPITTDDIVTQQFSPKRCILAAQIPVKGGEILHALNTHLSAFAQGSNTMEIQISQVDRILADIESNGGYGFIAGDFNLIPPGEAFNRLDEKGKKYFNPEGSEIIPLLKEYKMAPSYEDLFGIDYEKWLTNMAAYRDEKIPDKTIDYYFFMGRLEPDTSYVRFEDTIPISDHLPIITYFTIPEGRQ